MLRGDDAQTVTHLMKFWFHRLRRLHKRFNNTDWLDEQQAAGSSDTPNSRSCSQATPTVRHGPCNRLSSAHPILRMDTNFPAATPRRYPEIQAFACCPALTPGEIKPWNDLATCCHSSAAFIHRPKRIPPTACTARRQALPEPNLTTYRPNQRSDYIGAIQNNQLAKSILAACSNFLCPRHTQPADRPWNTPCRFIAMACCWIRFKPYWRLPRRRRHLAQTRIPQRNSLDMVASIILRSTAMVYGEAGKSTAIALLKLQRHALQRHRTNSRNN